MVGSINLKIILLTNLFIIMMISLFGEITYNLEAILPSSDNIKTVWLDEDENLCYLTHDNNLIEIKSYINGNLMLINSFSDIPTSSYYQHIILDGTEYIVMVIEYEQVVMYNINDFSESYDFDLNEFWYEYSNISIESYSLQTINLFGQDYLYFSIFFNHGSVSDNGEDTKSFLLGVIENEGIIADVGNYGKIISKYENSLIVDFVDGFYLGDGGGGGYRKVGYKQLEFIDNINSHIVSDEFIIDGTISYGFGDEDPGSSNNYPEKFVTFLGDENQSDIYFYRSISNIDSTSCEIVKLNSDFEEVENSELNYNFSNYFFTNVNGYETLVLYWFYDNHLYYYDIENFVEIAEDYTPFTIRFILTKEDGGNLFLSSENQIYSLSPNSVSNKNYDLSYSRNKIFNYPNPFNPTTKIQFEIQKDKTKYSVDVYNIKGQLVKRLEKGLKDKGTHSVIWNGEDAAGNSVSSGMYFFKLDLDGKFQSHKGLLLK